MKKLVTAFEFRELKKNYRFKIGAIITYILFFIALYSGYQQYVYEHAEINKTKEITYRQWVSQGDKNPHSAAHYGLYAFKPPSTLFIFDKGIEDYLGRAVWLEAHNQNEVKISQVKDQGLTGKFGYLSVSFIWQLFIPLFIVLLCFDSVNKLIESGTIKLLFSTGLKGKDLLWGKIFAISKLVGMYFLLPMALITSLVIVSVSPSEDYSGLFYYLFLIFIYSLYFLIWIIFSVYISSIFKASTALTILSGIWIFMGFLIPRISGTVAGLVHPAPSSYEFTEKVLTEREKGKDGTGSYEKFQEELKEKILKEYGVENLEDLPVSFAGYSLMESENKDWKIYDKHYGELNKKFKFQNFLIGWMNVFSPVQTQKSLSSAFSKTDINNHVFFAENAEAHRRLVQNILNEDQLKNGLGKERGYLAGKDLWKKIPEFQFSSNSFLNILKQQSGNLLLLILWILAGSLLLNRSGKTLKYLN